ncbi:MAG: DUF4115 domain-containing protein [Anaerolineae bacterium]|nr:DUF4115 domain-containing protein [Anaerolineae bacterium]
MSELGALLREARESKGLSLAEAAADTHIRQLHLEAIEEGRRKSLPDLVYLRGLVASYGRYLGLDPVEVRNLLEKEYGRASRGGGRVDSHQPLNEPLIGGGRLLLAIGLLVLAAIVVAAVLWWYWPVLESWGRDLFGWEPATNPVATLPLTAETAALALSDPTMTATVAVSDTIPTASPSRMDPTQEPTLPALPTSAALPLPTPGPTATAVPVVPSPTPTSTPVPGIWLQVRITSPAWLRVVADGEVVYEGTLQAGEVRQWFGGESVLLRTGNAGGTEVAVNGEDVGPLGEPGQIAEYVWTWDGDTAAPRTASD